MIFCSCDAIILVTPRGFLTNILGLAAIATSTIAFASTIALLHKYDRASEYTAGEAVRIYIGAWLEMSWQR